MATRILYLDGEGNARQHAGDLSSLLERIAAERADAEAAERAARERGAKGRPRGESGGSNRAPPPDARKRSFKEQQEFDALPARIAAAEEEAATIDAQFADPVFYSGPRAAIEKAQARRAELTKQIERLYARWAELD